jgi:hypothetical protein
VLGRDVLGLLKNALEKTIDSSRPTIEMANLEVPSEASPVPYMDLPSRLLQYESVSYMYCNTRPVPAIRQFRQMQRYSAI